MDLAQYLESIGAKVDAAVVRQVVRNTLRLPSASPSDLVEALAVTMNPDGAQVCVDHAGTGEGGAAGKVIAFLVGQGEIRIADRRAYATDKLAAG